MKKQVVLAAYILFFIILFSFSIIGVQYTVSFMRKVMQKETDTYLTEISVLCSRIVEKQTQTDLESMKIYAQTLTMSSGVTPESLRDFFISVAEHMNFKRVGLILPDGSTYTSDNFRLNLSQREYFVRGMRGEANVSDMLTDMIDGQYIVAYAVPVIENEKVTAVFFAVQNVDAYSKLVNINPLEGAGLCYIIKPTGEFITLPEIAFADGTRQKAFSQTIFSFLKNAEISDNNYYTFFTQISRREQGVVSYTIEGKKIQLAYAPVADRNWMLLIAFESNFINKNSDMVVSRVTAVGTLIVTILFVIFLVLSMREYMHQKEIENIAFVDKVTGFSTWEKFRRDAEKLLSGSWLQYVVISFETQNFRMYNEVYGYEKANIFLCHIAECINNACNHNETFCRLSSDNFIILFSYETASQIEEHISTLLEHIELVDETNMSSCRFGVYQIVDRKMSISECCDKAYVAKIAAKQSMYESVVYYNESMHQKLIADNELEKIKEDALANGEFVMYLQPKVSIKTSMVIGAEALVRWNHPKEGLVSPVRFLPLFERSGFIMQIDFEICRQACALIRTWLDSGMIPVSISVNFSRLHFHQKNFIEKVNEVVDSFNIPHNYIEIEITETIAEAFSDVSFIRNIIFDFQKNGYKVSMDDFGAGYSSLNMLAKLPVNVLKMDKYFFERDQFTKDTGSSHSIISGVINIAKNLNMQVVAEGIEDQEQYDMLQRMNCDMIQGYYFSPPMPVDKFENYLYVCNVVEQGEKPSANFMI